MNIKKKQLVCLSTPVPKDAERHWDVNLILFSLSTEKWSSKMCKAGISVGAAEVSKHANVNQAEVSDGVHTRAELHPCQDSSGTSSSARPCPL